MASTSGVTPRAVESLRTEAPTGSLRSGTITSLMEDPEVRPSSPLLSVVVPRNRPATVTANKSEIRDSVITPYLSQNVGDGLRVRSLVFLAFSRSSLEAGRVDAECGSAPGTGVEACCIARLVAPRALPA